MGTEACFSTAPALLRTVLGARCFGREKPVPEPGKPTVNQMWSPATDEKLFHLLAPLSLLVSSSLFLPLCTYVCVSAHVCVMFYARTSNSAWLDVFVRSRSLAVHKHTGLLPFKTELPGLLSVCKWTIKTWRGE